jgi:hypothetical protein
MYIIPAVVFLASFFIGLFIFLKPDSAIEFQRRFYEKINWKIEPISMAREVRNTKVMGVFLISLTMGMAILYFFLK